MPVTRSVGLRSQSLSPTNIGNEKIDEKKRQDQPTISKTTIAAGVITVAALATIAYLGSDLVFGGYGGYNGYTGV